MTVSGHTYDLDPQRVQEALQAALPGPGAGDHRRGPEMRFPFGPPPAAGGGTLTPRPVVDIALEGLAAAPMECLLDTGALRTRMSAELAPLAGIELTAGLTEEFYIGGPKTTPAPAPLRPPVPHRAPGLSSAAPVWVSGPLA